MSALRRVFKRPIFLLLLWAASSSMAWLLNRPVRAVASSAMDGFAVLDDGHVMLSIMELMRDNSGVAAASVTAILGSVVVSTLFWIAFAPAVISALEDDRNDMGDVFGAAGNWLGANAVQTIFGMLLRVVFVVGPIFALKPLGAPGLVLVAIAWAIPVLALDRARAHLVLDDPGRHFHPKHVPVQLWRLLKSPAHLVGGTLLVLVQWGLLGLALWATLADVAGAASIWVTRVLALLALAAALWRVALSVEAERD